MRACVRVCVCVNVDEMRKLIMSSLNKSNVI